MSAPLRVIDFEEITFLREYFRSYIHPCVYGFLAGMLINWLK